MKYILFTAAVLAFASGPAYSRMSDLFDRNIVLISAFAPGTAALFTDDAEKKKPSVIALAD